MASRFWPHQPKVEDQTMSQPMLISHILHRGAQTGAGLSPFFLLPKLYFTKSASLAAIPLMERITIPVLLHSAGTGTMVGMGVVALETARRMWGEDIYQWQQRVWRILENKGQLEVDDWSVFGTAMGVAAGISQGGLEALGWRAMVGAASFGNLATVGGYLVWRYGINGGVHLKEVTYSGNVRKEIKAL